MSRRREDYVGSCIHCGAVLGIWELPQMEAHVCPFVERAEEIDRNDLNDTLAEMRATRGEED